MVGIEDLTFANLQPGEAIAGLWEVADFDRLALRAGTILLQNLKETHPEFEYDDPNETLYTARGSTIAAKLSSFIGNTSVTYEAVFLQLTQPDDINFIRGRHLNLLTTVKRESGLLKRGSGLHSVETKIYLKKIMGEYGELIQARKQVDWAIHVNDETAHTNMVERKLKRRMRPRYYKYASGHDLESRTAS